MSSSARVILQPAFILHQRPFRNTSLLIEALTAEHGRIGIVARGVRGAKSRTQALLQPFQPLLMSWFGRGELVTLSAVEPSGVVQRITGRGVLSGFYINELLVRLLHRHDAHPVLFEHYTEALQILEDPAQEQRALRIFEKHLLQELGYALQLNHRADTGEPLVHDTLYSYQLETGPLPHDERHPTAITMHGHSLLSLANNQLHDALSLRETKYLTRASLALYLGDKPLQSRKLLAQLLNSYAPKIPVDSQCP